MEYKSVLETFYEWKQWVLKNGRTPVRLTEDDYERHLNYKIVFYMSGLRKANQHPELLAEYRQIQLQYNPRYNRTKNEIMQEWVEWCVANKKIPQRKKDGSYEDKLFIRMYCMLYNMRKEPVKYASMLEEYKRIYSLYGRKRTKEQRIDEWEVWVKINGRLPSIRSADEQEVKLACNIRRIYFIMKKDPDTYAVLLDRYQKVYNEYVSTSNKRVRMYYDAWMEWVKQNKMLPSSDSKDKKEADIANKLGYALSRMRENQEYYAEDIKEYINMREKYKFERKYNRHKTEFQKYKSWILQNGRMPKQNSNDKEEKNMSWRMWRIFNIILENEETYPAEYTEIKEILAKYNSVTSNCTISVYEEWKNWCKANNRLPKSNSTNKYEKSLYTRIRYCIHLMKESEDEYAKELAEYAKLKEEYRSFDINLKTFEAWKAWCETHNRLPRSHISDKAELNVYSNMYYRQKIMRKQYEKYSEILKEYEEIKLKYRELKKEQTKARNEAKKKKKK